MIYTIIRKRFEVEIVTRELRFLYYDDYLFKNGVITKREHDKMNLAKNPITFLLCL